MLRQNQKVSAQQGHGPGTRMRRGPGPAETRGVSDAPPQAEPLSARRMDAALGTRATPAVSKTLTSPSRVRNLKKLRSEESFLANVLGLCFFVRN